MRFFTGLGLFWSGIICFAFASTAGEPDVYMWLMGAMTLLAGLSLVALDYLKDERES